MVSAISSSGAAAAVLNQTEAATKSAPATSTAASSRATAQDTVSISAAGHQQLATQAGDADHDGDSA